MMREDRRAFASLAVVPPDVMQRIFAFLLMASRWAVFVSSVLPE